MADVQLYGLRPAGHHATNVLLHAASAGLLFLLLNAMTRATARSAFAAALWAVHPLRVESVAWVAERKDVLSGLFFLLTLLAYTRYARAAGRDWYAAALGFFAVGLLAKPSLVTLPFVLLLLDYWPFGRWQAGAARRLLLEKTPFLVLTAVSCAVTVFAQTRATVSITQLPPDARVANATFGYVTYLWEMIHPVDLAVLYPLRVPPWWLPWRCRCWA